MRARRLLAAGLAFAAALAVFTATRGGERAAAGPPAAALALRPAGDTDAEIARLVAQVRRGRLDHAAALADAYLQKARETGDPTFYTRAEDALRRAPDDPRGLVPAAMLAAARHDFRGALRLARRARAAAPEAVAPYPVLVDALVELGRYRSAERTLQKLIDLKPTLSSYARVSYFRELYGDLRGATDVMARAVSAGGPAPENVAYVQSLLGSLDLMRGRGVAARRAFHAALAAVPGYPPAAAGRARLAAAAGHARIAIRRWRAIVARLPLPEYMIALGEAELAAGRAVAGRRDLALVRVQERLLARAGVDTDVELAVYEADHGDRRRGLALARAAWAAAPSVRSADAVGWALTCSGRPRVGLRWAQRALRLGSLEPTFRYHAGVAALAAGRHAAGRRNLRLALAHGLAGHPLPAARTREALR